MHDIINRLRTKKGDEGFTLIELLVVVVIIGVLVAIAVPVYLNYRKGAADKSAQSDARAAVSTVEQYYTDNGNAYPPATTCSGKTASFQFTTAGCVAGTAGASGWTVLSDKSTMTYVLVTTSTPNTYKICTTNSGGSGKVYLYDSSVGGSVTAVTSPSSTYMTACA
jgi:type IV pilus assembly protein PilA